MLSRFALLHKDASQEAGPGDWETAERGLAVMRVYIFALASAITGVDNSLLAKGLLVGFLVILSTMSARTTVPGGHIRLLFIRLVPTVAQTPNWKLLLAIFHTSNIYPTNFSGPGYDFKLHPGADLRC